MARPKKSNANRVKSDEQSGIIFEGKGMHYLVQASDGEFYNCRTLRSTVSENPDATLAVVGDSVTLKPTLAPDEENYGEGVITKVFERRMKLARKRNRKTNRSGEAEHVMASNIEQLVIVSSVAMPPIRLGLIDRYLAFAESEGLDALIVINKMDLEHSEELAGDVEIYRSLGYKSLLLSSVTGMGMDELRRELQQKISVFTGHSGVGKSALISALTGEELRIGEVSQKSLRGAHTTSNAIMLSVPGKTKDDAGFVIDTPGIREFALTGIDPLDLRHFFIEFQNFAPDCGFSSCSHTIEPNCAVRSAYQNGEIFPTRYESYLAIYSTLDEYDDGY